MKKRLPVVSRRLFSILTMIWRLITSIGWSGNCRMHRLKKHEPRLVRHHLESLPPSYTAHWHTTLQSHSRQERYAAYENWKALHVVLCSECLPGDELAAQKAQPQTLYLST